MIGQLLIDEKDKLNGLTFKGHLFIYFFLFAEVRQMSLQNLPSRFADEKFRPSVIIKTFPTLGWNSAKRF